MRLWIGLTLAAAVTLGGAMAVPARATPLLPVAAANTPLAAEPADVTPVRWYRYHRWHYRRHYWRHRVYWRHRHWHRRHWY